VIWVRIRAIDKEHRVELADAPRYSSTWLELRERADAQARAAELLAPLCDYLAGLPSLVVRDLGSGTASMQRWLAPQLPGPQRWVLHDHDPALLSVAWARATAVAADGAPVVVETEPGDLRGLTAAELAGTSLVTASALLDLLTFDEMEALADTCCRAGVPVLLTLSVLGRAELNPADQLDEAFSAAFAEHLRLGVEHRHLLGPDAADAAAQAFAGRGATVWVRPSPWRLGAEHASLITEWLRGWVPAAVAANPELEPHAEGYLQRRLIAADAGALRVSVHHADVLALP
jgi:hypothetical protein